MSYTPSDLPGTERPVPTLEVTDRDRLAALASYGILDTPAEDAFDDIVAIASEVCDAPCALISLVAAERQWFKAKVGFEACETPLDQSVCAHAIGEPEMLVIPDLTMDPRTRANPLVSGPPHMRFYGGVVLRNPDGHALGSLCVLDDKPRPDGLSELQTSVLRALGRQVMAFLEIRKSLIRSVDDQLEQARSQRGRDAAAVAIREHEMKLRLAVDATRLGIFDYDLVTGMLSWDARVRELFGVTSTEPISYEDSFLGGVHPDDREHAHAAVQRALDPSGSGLFEAEYRTVSPDGTVRWLSARGQTAVEDRTVVRFVGTVRDVTARRMLDDQIAATLERYRLVGSVTQDVIWDWDLTNDHVLWNDSLTVAYGHRLADVDPTPGWWLEHVHPDDRERVRDDIFNVINGEEFDWSHDYRFLRADGSWADVFDRGSLIRDPAGRPLRMIGAMFDNSVRKAAEERQGLLNRELSHRMKNILTMVQAIAAQTFRSAESIDEAQRMLSGRLVALSTAHDILLGGRSDGANLSTVINDAVRIHLDTPERVAVQGPDVEIGPKAALPFVLMLHELATNAVKYGALSNGAGHIVVEWSVTGAHGEKVLRFAWIERDGPPVAKPSRTGFGSRLIERGIAAQLGATVTLDYRPEGVACLLEASLDRLREVE